MTPWARVPAGYGFQVVPSLRDKGTRPTCRSHGGTSGSNTLWTDSSRTQTPLGPSQTRTWNLPVAYFTWTLSRTASTCVNAPSSPRGTISAQRSGNNKAAPHQTSRRHISYGFLASINAFTITSPASITYLALPTTLPMPFCDVLIHPGLTLYLPSLLNIFLSALDFNAGLQQSQSFQQ